MSPLTLHHPPDRFVKVGSYLELSAGPSQGRAGRCQVSGTVRLSLNISDTGDRRLVSLILTHGHSIGCSLVICMRTSLQVPGSHSAASSLSLGDPETTVLSGTVSGTVQLPHLTAGVQELQLGHSPNHVVSREHMCIGDPALPLWAACSTQCSALDIVGFLLGRQGGSG